MKAPARRTLTIVAVLASFFAGVLVDWRLRTYGPPKPVVPPAETLVREPSTPQRPAETVVRPLPAPQPPLATIAPVPVATTGSHLSLNQQRVKFIGTIRTLSRHVQCPLSIVARLLDIAG